MSLKQTLILAVALIMSYASGVVTGQTERLELLGNMKLFGPGNGVIFPDGTKQTSAGVGSSTDVTCAIPCVGAGEIAANAVGTTEVTNGSLTQLDLADGSVASNEVENKTLRLADLYTTVAMSQTVALGFVINAATCAVTSTQASGAAAHSYAIIFGVRRTDGAPNTGWAVEAEENPSGVGSAINIRVCNFTGTNATPPSLRFSFWTIAQ